MKAIYGLLILIPIVAGCGEAENSLKTFPATGTILVKGKPEAGINVQFVNKDGSNSIENILPTGNTDAEGKFVVSTFKTGDGLPVGDYAVTLRWIRQTPSSEQKATKDRIPGFDPPADVFGGKFNNPDTTPYSVTITEGDNTLEVINVK
ncbi:hypothetical protein [Calycomorphotria hydatis]|uniref:Nickel uptake substrate-specific transmembrane region n=1 Tax=Calycomorphotria hydatis TaxID=2528027 RepID=A0A517T7Q3_9PLAN|nr:hypothetical protein [Calycomorphotria hydatis]QDT64380.1 hypothetical protein V22_16140 [Calycomorphotria hydatis]